MRLALILLSVVALSTAAPQNYTSHFQVFQDSTTDPTPSSTNTTIEADVAVTTVKSTYVVAGTSSVNTTLAANDEHSDTGGTTKVPSGSTYSTTSVNYTRGGAASVTAGATFITEATTVVTSATTYETNVTTETTFSNNSTSTAKLGTSGFTHSTDSTTSTTESATTSTDGTTYSRDSRASSKGDATGDRDGALDTTIGTTTDATDVIFGSSGSKDGVTRTTDGATHVTTGVSRTTDEMTETSIGVTAGSDVPSEIVESSTEIVFGTIIEETDDKSSTDAFIKIEKGDRTTIMTPTDHERSKIQGNSNKIISGTVEEPGFGFTFKLPAFFTTILQTVPTIGSTRSNTTSSDTSANVHRKGGSNVNSNAPSFNGGRISDRTTTTTTVSPSATVPGISFKPSGAPNNIVPSSSIDAVSSNQSFSGLNFLSTSDFTNQQTPLHPEHSSRVMKALAESGKESNQGAIDYSGLHLNPDYYALDFTAVGRDKRDAYDYDYYSQLFPPVGTPEEYEEDYSQSGNDGGYSDLFQYIIKTSNLPGELASLQTSSSLSALTPKSPETYLPQGAYSTGSQTDAGHLPLASQPENPFSLFPAFLSSSIFNFAANQRPPFGFPNSMGGSFITNANSASGTQKPVVTYHSTTSRTSIGSTTRHQHKKADSFSATQRHDETYYSTTTEASITTEGNDQSLSAWKLESSNNATSSSSSTNSPQIESEVTTEIIDGTDLVTTTAEEINRETSIPKVGSNKSVKNSKLTSQVQ